MSASWPPDTFTHLMQSVSVGIKGGGLRDGGAAENAEVQPAVGSRAKAYIRSVRYALHCVAVRCGAPRVTVRRARRRVRRPRRARARAGLLRTYYYLGSTCIHSSSTRTPYVHAKTPRAPVNSDKTVSEVVNLYIKFNLT